MAGGAIRAELTKVLGWFGVTGSTFLGRAFVNAVFMARLALHICMGAVQFESGEAVIERGWRPAFGRMAGFAGCAVLAAMRVVSLMTGVAILRGGSQVADFACVDMTQAAIHLCVFARQWKSETVVVEGVAVGIDTIMAGKTVRAESDEMNLGVDKVHFTVAGQAGVRGEGGDVINVAVGAFKGLSIQIASMSFE